jgi:hypothetical protein
MQSQLNKENYQLSKHGICVHNKKMNERASTTSLGPPRKINTRISFDQSNLYQLSARKKEPKWDDRNITTRSTSPSSFPKAGFNNCVTIPRSRHNRMQFAKEEYTKIMRDASKKPNMMDRSLTPEPPQYAVKQIVPTRSQTSLD